MIPKSRNGIRWLEFEQLQHHPQVIHGFTLREGGVSPAPFDSLNLGIGVGDLDSHIEENCSRLQTIFTWKACARAKQEHGRVIQTIGSVAEARDFHVCDGFITAHPDVAIMVQAADCQVALFFDPHSGAVGVAHAGWRGSVANIYQHMVERFLAEFASRPEDILVSVGPSLGPQAAEFRNFRAELPQSFWKHQVAPTYFDFWAITEEQLLACGIRKNNIEIARLCTYSHPAQFFSYRRDTITGRHALVALLRAQ